MCKEYSRAETERVGKAIYDAYQLGGSKKLKVSLEQNGLEDSFYLYRTRDKDEVFPCGNFRYGVYEAISL